MALSADPPKSCPIRRLLIKSLVPDMCPCVHEEWCKDRISDVTEMELDRPIASLSHPQKKTTKSK